MKLQLTKSDYMMYLKHPAWLWLKKHDKSKLPPVDDNLQAVFDTGHKFEPYAEARFPGGTTLGFNDYGQYLSLPKRTQAALDEGAATLFQGRVEHGQLTCIFDVLERTEGGYNLYEIKSATREKREHLLDLAFQKHVLELAGLPVKRCSVIVVNPRYVRRGDIEARKLTRVIDVTAEVDALAEQTKTDIAAALAVMDSPTRPDISPRYAQGYYVKDWIEIFLSLSATDTDPYSIYRLSSLKGDLLGELEDQGIQKISQIPPDFPLQHAKYQRVVELSRLGAPVIDAAKVADFLRTFTFPLYFFDYETMSSIIPPFDGTRPFQQLPTQYSLHILPAPGAELVHKEFLHRDSSDPCLPLLKQLVEDIGTEGTVLAWYDKFEKGVNESLGELHPDYKDRMTALNDRILDLMTPFSQGWYEDYRFLGSASIKKVLPVLVPDLTYKTLTVQNGEAAQRLWMETVLEGKNPDGKEQLFKDLLEYCGLDTYAMVRIYQALLERSAGA